VVRCEGGLVPSDMEPSEVVSLGESVPKSGAGGPLVSRSRSQVLVMTDAGLGGLESPGAWPLSLSESSPTQNTATSREPNTVTTWG